MSRPRSHSWQVAEWGLEPKCVPWSRQSVRLCAQGLLPPFVLGLVAIPRPKRMGSPHTVTLFAPALGLMTHVSGIRRNINPARLCQAPGQPHLLLSSGPPWPSAHGLRPWNLRKGLWGCKQSWHSQQRRGGRYRGSSEHLTAVLLQVSTLPQAGCATLGRSCLSLDLCSPLLRGSAPVELTHPDVFENYLVPDLMIGPGE